MSEPSFTQAVADFATEMADVLHGLPAAMSSPAARRITAATLRLQRAAERAEADLDARFDRLRAERLAEAPALKAIVEAHVKEALAATRLLRAVPKVSEPGSLLSA